MISSLFFAENGKEGGGVGGERGEEEVGRTEAERERERVSGATNVSVGGRELFPEVAYFFFFFFFFEGGERMINGE